MLYFVTFICSYCMSMYTCSRAHDDQLVIALDQIKSSTSVYIHVWILKYFCLVSTIQSVKSHCMSVLKSVLVLINRYTYHFCVSIIIVNVIIVRTCLRYYSDLRRQ